MASRDKAGVLIRCSLAIVLCPILLTCISCGASVENKVEMPGSEKPAGEYAPGQVIVRFKDGISDEQRDRVIVECGGQAIVEPLGGETQDTYLIGLKPGITVEQAVSQFQFSESVVFAEPNAIRTIHR